MMHKPKYFIPRCYVLYALLGLLLLGLLWRLVDLSVIDRHFLLKQSQVRIMRDVNIQAHRGMIVDRNETPLAISTPVDSVWINPQLFHPTAAAVTQIAQLLDIDPAFIYHRFAENKHREFAYLKRHVTPPIAERVMQLKVDGVYLEPEYQRYYPSGEVDAQLLGFTNIDDKGAEGLELEFNSYLKGTPGKKEVLIDRLGHAIANVKLMKQPVQGHELVLSIDQRLQYLAYRNLKAAVKDFDAAAGAVVILNAQTGEILAMANQPSYNPNNRPQHDDGQFRNRAVTDMFEPGSTIKPFNISLALMSGKYHVDSKVDTHPGWMTVGGYTIKDDVVDNGVITLTQILQKSSNIGAAKVMLTLKPQDYWELLSHLGFGERTDTGFPGEASGRLVYHSVWYPSVIASMAYGYGIAVTVLQLAHAYSILADGGIRHPLSLLRLDQPPAGVRVLPADTANTVLHMLESVLQKGGTGTRARVAGYRIAGKTGTAYIAGPHGYYKHRYISSFVGVAPVTDPQLVVAVVIFDPRKKHHFGAYVAAPVFAKVMGDALRLLNIAPDDLKG